MARKKSGGLNRILNFIGLVDDEDSRDTYGEEYYGDNYGRRQPYTPPRQSNGRASRQNDRRRLEAPAPRSRFDDGRSSRTTDGYDDYRASDRRSASRFDDGYDRDGRSSRYDAPRASSRYAAQPPVPRNPQPRRAMQVSRRTRTVMYSLHTLKDCTKVIDDLISNNTVVLSMEELEGGLMQRALDTLSGAAFALDANIRKASDRTYLITPTSVEVNDGYEDLDY